MAQFFKDTFTDTDQTLLTAHTPDNGAAYAAVIGSVAPIIQSTIAGGSLGPNGTTYVMWRSTTAATSTEQSITANVYFNTGTFSSAGICGRVASDGSRGYALLYLKASGTWSLQRLVGGSFTEIASYAMAVTTGSSYAIELRITGTGATVTVEAYVNSTNVATYADTNANRATAAGYPALWFNPAGGGTGQGMLLQDLTGSDGAVAGAGGTAATAVTMSGPTSGPIGSASSAFTIGANGAITGTVTVTPSDGGAGGTFNPSSVQISSGTPTATFTYTASSNGAKTISVSNNGGLTNPTNITYTAATAALTAGVASYASATNAVINMSATAASGGTAPLTYQWYRSTTANFTPGAGNLLAGATSLTLADSASLVADTPYFYVCRVTDAASQTADSNQVAGALKAAPLNLGFIGDSITAGYGLSAGQDPPTQIVPILRKLYKDRTITATNKAVSGSKTSQWVTGQANLTNAKTAFASAGVTHVHIMLGANDAASSNLVSAATYKSNLQNIIADLNGAGYKVILSYPTYIPAGANNNATTAASVSLARSYMAQIDSLIDNVNVLRGDVWSYDYFIGNLGEYQTDMTHPTAAGAISLATIWARAIEANVLSASAAATSARTVTLTLGDTSGPLANLTGIKVAAFDQPTPDLRAAPQYKSSSQATDASGVLTFTMQSTLAAGGICGVSVQLADGRNFDVSTAVA